MSAVFELVKSPIASAFIAAVVAFAVTSFTIRSRTKERYLAKELKLSEYRQVWINNLRDAIAEFGAKTSGLKSWDERGEDIVGLTFKIEMMMNPEDPDYAALRKALKYRADAVGKNGAVHLDEAHDNLMEVGQRVLKREWKRVRSDLDKIVKGQIK